MAQLNAEIIAIGDEMISGARIDTNTAWISKRLAALGVDVHFHSTVGDTLAHNTELFRIATRRADIVVATGGLGPTRDDLTREAMAEALGRPLQLDPDSLAQIEALFQRRGREMPERNQSQALFPLGSSPISNPQGTAPGINAVATREDGTVSRIFALPGVPDEMKAMFDASVAPAILATNDSGQHIRHCVMKFFGIGESDMEQRLGDMIDRRRQPRVGITVSAATISLRISAMAESAEECVSMIAKTRDEILERAGDLYFGDGESYEQHHALEARLRISGERLLVVELGHAAPLNDWFASLGQSPALAGGLSLAQIDDLLRLADSTSLEQCCTFLRDRFAADWILMVDAYPDLPHEDSSSSDCPPEVTFTINTPGDQVLTKTSRTGGHPSIIHPRIAKSALMFLRESLGR